MTDARLDFSAIQNREIADFDGTKTALNWNGTNDFTGDGFYLAGDMSALSLGSSSLLFTEENEACIANRDKFSSVTLFGKTAEYNEEKECRLADCEDELGHNLKLRGDAGSHNLTIGAVSAD